MGQKLLGNNIVNSGINGGSDNIKVDEEEERKEGDDMLWWENIYRSNLKNNNLTNHYIYYFIHIKKYKEILC